MAVKTLLILAGIGRKDSNAVLAAEFFRTLEATHGNSAQHKSLTAILKRAESTFTASSKYDGIMARRNGSADDTPADPNPEATAEADELIEPPVKPVRKVRKARTVESDDAAAVEDDAGTERSFVKRMRALAAQNEKDGVRN